MFILLYDTNIRGGVFFFSSSFFSFFKTKSKRQKPKSGNPIHYLISKFGYIFFFFLLLPGVIISLLGSIEAGKPIGASIWKGGGEALFYFYMHGIGMRISPKCLLNHVLYNFMYYISIYL